MLVSKGLVFVILFNALQQACTLPVLVGSSTQINILDESALFEQGTHQTVLDKSPPNGPQIVLHIPY